MRAKLHPRLRLARIRHPWASYTDDQNGAFAIIGPCQRRLLCIASNGAGWDHVSVSIAGNEEIPTWDEMRFVKDLFFEAEEPAFQFHPPQSRYVNVWGGCLHLWRPQDVAMPMPSLELV